MRAQGCDREHDDARVEYVHEKAGERKLDREYQNRACENDPGIAFGFFYREVNRIDENAYDHGCLESKIGRAAPYEVFGHPEETEKDDGEGNDGGEDEKADAQGEKDECVDVPVDRFKVAGSVIPRDDDASPDREARADRREHALDLGDKGDGGYDAGADVRGDKSVEKPEKLADAVVKDQRQGNRKEYFPKIAFQDELALGAVFFAEGVGHKAVLSCMNKKNCTEFDFQHMIYAYFAMNTHDFRIQDSEAGFTLIRKSRAPTNPERHFHGSYELLYIISGERTFFHGKTTLFIKTGDFLCIKPEVLHRALNRNNEVCDLFNIYFDDPASPFFKELLPLFSAFGTPEEPVLSIGASDRFQILRLLTGAAQELDGKKSGYILLAQALLTQCLVALSRCTPSLSGKTSGLPMNPKIRAILDWLSLEFRKPVTLARTASKFGISETYLSRLFRHTTHFSFIEYLTSLRIQEACRLLSSSRDTVSDISFSCGFGSVTQFGRCFRRITGEAPLSYRKREASPQ